MTLYFVLALWFCPGAGYSEVLRVLFKQLRGQVAGSRWKIPTVSAAVQARRRLSRAPLKALFRRLCGAGTAAHLPGMTAFGRELALLKVSADGTRLDVAWEVGLALHSQVVRILHGRKPLQRRSDGSLAPDRDYLFRI